MKSIEITITDDAKGKYQSFESNVECWDDAGNGMGHYNFDITGYGDTESECKSYLITQLEHMIAQLQSIEEQINNTETE